MNNWIALREEALKNKIAETYFKAYEHTDIIGNIDFVVARRTTSAKSRQIDMLQESGIYSVLWAESKRGIVRDINESFVQLILTIGKARTFTQFAPPTFLGAFDAEKIAFIEYGKILHIFSKNDFNWNVTPSNHSTKEFAELYNLVEEILSAETIIFNYEHDSNELKKFIKNNFGGIINEVAKIQIDKNNFTYVYQKWANEVKPSIEADWNRLKAVNIIEADFFLADLLSENNKTIKEKLSILLQSTYYELDRKIDEYGMENSKKIRFKDKLKAHKRFWNLYERPPKEEYWEYIVKRRDLLVPQDIREREGTYFTPKIWVEKSQEYLTSVLGENWQEEYYVWDCCAGTGNLLNGLTNKKNIWASTLIQADVDVMKDRIENGWNMFADHVFQFDFLNDDFSKCPEKLQEIINNPEKRRKLVVYINPPYVEAANSKTTKGTGKNKENVSNKTTVWLENINKLGKSLREIFIQFFFRIYFELNGCILGEFSKLKMIQSPNFKTIRNIFHAKLCRSFIVPAKTFDNVRGSFPIGFFVWDTRIKESIKTTVTDMYDKKGNFIGQRKIICYNEKLTINDWLKQYVDKSGKNKIAAMCCIGTDFGHQNYVNINFAEYLKGVGNAKGIAKFAITHNNFLQVSIYHAVRHCIPATWQNDKDQFLAPKNNVALDPLFSNNCVIFTCFSEYNNISSEHGINHWIPFTEEQVGSKNEFKSHFMSDFLKNKLPFLTSQAREVYDAGLELWQYYFSKRNIDINASYYDIRFYFQGTNGKKMNNKSNDEYYNQLIENLRAAQKILAKEIANKVYEYGFLK